MKNIKFLTPIFAFLIASSGLLAGDFLALPRCPDPDSLNKNGIPIYESYYDGQELPNYCAEAIGEEGAELYSTSLLERI